MLMCVYIIRVVCMYIIMRACIECMDFSKANLRVLSKAALSIPLTYVNV